MNASFSEIAQALNGADRIAILSHVRPDGDAIGSQLALALSLVQLGKTVVAWNEDGLLGSFRFLNRSDIIQKPPIEQQDFDVVVALDTATQQRLGKTLDAIGKAKTWINIDHHASNPGYGDLVYIDTAAAATGEIIYEFLRDANFPLTYEAADALYAAISTDTGSFHYPNTTSRSFEIAAELIKAGVDAGTICRNLYESYPKRRMQLVARILPNAAFDLDDKIASLALPQTITHELGIQPDDVDGLIDYVRCIRSVIVAIFFEELADGKIRISMRSKDARIDVSRICMQFGGGGHPLAAGARMRGSLEEVRHKILKRVIDEVSQHI
jgi:phosphoesterase RecJ-like protein